MTSADKVGGWVKKGQKHDDVILKWSLCYIFANDLQQPLQASNTTRTDLPERIARLSVKESFFSW